MAEIDPRQDGLFAAAWMVGYAARLAEAGVESFVGAALTGPFGLIAPDAASGRTRLRPVGHAAKFLASMGGGCGACGCVERSLKGARARRRTGSGAARCCWSPTSPAASSRSASPSAGRALILDERTVLAGEEPRRATLADGPVLLPAYAVMRLEA